MLCPGRRAARRGCSGPVCNLRQRAASGRHGRRLWAAGTCFVVALACGSHADAAVPADERLAAALESVAPAQPYEVGVGVQVEQVVSINQKDESFEVVGNLRLQWKDPKLAFDERAYGQSFRMSARDAFVRFAEANGIFVPAFGIHNQQGQRWTQNSGVIVFSDGQAIYGERFTVKLQAPEFDFARYPFDTQKFFVHVEAVYPTAFMRFVPLAGFSRLGERLGEEEWLFEKSWGSTAEVEGVTGRPTSRYSFGFQAHRHLNYYLLRIFVPLGIIVLVSWLTFFLQDFGKRVDIAGANLLIFVAFNFTISSDLPRLGYMTFMDAIIAATFVFSALVVVMNVIFKRMEIVGRERLARRIDNFTIWVYPVTLAMLVLACWYWFVVEGRPGIRILQWSGG